MYDKNKEKLTIIKKLSNRKAHRHEIVQIIKSKNPLLNLHNIFKLHGKNANTLPTLYVSF